MNTDINGYIYSINVSTVISKNKTTDKCYPDRDIVDLFYYNLDTLETECIRIDNLLFEFMISRLPGMDDKRFTNFVVSCTEQLNNNGETISLTYVRDYTDASYFRFGKTDLFIKAECKSVSKLTNLRKKLTEECKNYLNKLDMSKLDPYDSLTYNFTESPFRFISFLNKNNSKYFLPTKFNIPCAGGIKVKAGEWLKDKAIPNAPTPNIKKIYYFDAGPKNSNVYKHIKQCDENDDKSVLSLLSYDIETYTQNTKLLEKDKVVMCIGIGFFDDILNKTPHKRYCLTLKDFTTDDLSKLTYTTTNKKQYKQYIVSNEYSNKPNDNTVYKIFKSEADMLRNFVKIIQKKSPTFITGFNNFTFDDIYIYNRIIKFYPYLLNEMKQAFSFYKINDDIINESNNDKLLPKFEANFKLKIDGQEYNDNSTWKGTKIISIDVYKIMIAANAKLFTQQGRGTLDSMLEIKHILNPYNNKQLGKSGMTYIEMYNAWNNNHNLYDIALYCCQDAWITGTLLITVSELVDKIEMSTLTCTTISDSFYKAVTFRVSYILLKYAYINKFAVYDDASTRHAKNAVPLLQKQFDDRRIKGGEVRSVKPGKNIMVVALDYNAMYPSQKEASNIDTSSRVPDDIIENPDKYGIKILEKKDIIDMYTNRSIYYVEKDKKEYTIEEFFCEFKLDEKEIESNILTFNNSEIPEEKEKAKIELLKLYPEYFTDYDFDSKISLSKTNIPESVTKKIYYVQSPKDEKTNLPTIHYSFKEMMLSDLRSLRNSVKRLMSNAEKENNSTEVIRYNAKQLAIKNVCNSEYGATQSEFFAYYDPIIAGTVTHASRMLIHFLSIILESDKLYVDEQFIKENNKHISILSNSDLLKVEIADKSIVPPRTLTLRRMFDNRYNFIADEYYILHMKPSTVIYQDTDSNYYINEYLQSKYESLTPELINECMHIMKIHNELVAVYANNAIGRKPIGLGFEAAKIVSRYFQVKKKYYGIAWDPNMSSKLQDEAYVNDILIKDYSKYWKPKISTLPTTTGSYIHVDSDVLLHKRIDYSEYTSQQNITTTGIDLKRRDAYKFINFSHMKILENDLKLIKYKGNNEWETYPKNMTLESSVNNVLSTFKYNINRIKQIVDCLLNETEDEHNFELPEPFYRLEDYSKQVTYKQDVGNTIIKAIRERMEKNRKNGKSYIEMQVFEKVNYVIILTEESRKLQCAGKTADGSTSSKAYLIKELMEMYKEEYPEDIYVTFKNHEKIDYELFIELIILTNLDFRHYMKSLCSAMALYALEYLDPDAINQYNNAIVSSKELSEKIIKPAKDRITNTLLQQYFKFGKEVTKQINEYKNIDKKYIKENITRMKKISKEEEFRMYCNIVPCAKNYTDNIPVNILKKILTSLNNELTKINNGIEFINEIVQEDCTNNFIENTSKVNLYNKFKTDKEYRIKTYELYIKRRINISFAISFTERLLSL